MATGWIRTSSFSENGGSGSPPFKRSRRNSDCGEGSDWFNGEMTVGQNGSQQRESKIFNDSVHGPIKLHPLLVSIIDTPQFQRLRDIKQLGASYWVFPGGCANRFEHCIGTSYLCGVMLKTLRDLHNNQYKDGIEITDKDILCITVAGLCHDLGHGPFSHVFDNKYIRYIDPESKWQHEDGSVDMFDYMLEDDPDLIKTFEEYELYDTEREFIKELILGKKPDEDSIKQTCIYQGKEKEKWFLYEVVANKRNGIDCDKFDYFMRDCHHVGTKSNFDPHRYFHNIRIMLVDDQLQICVREKEIFNLYELFHTRWSLHHRVYQHKTTKVIEQMFVEALAKVDEKFGISASIRDMSKYVDMTDSLIYQILRHPDDNDENLKEAKQIIRSIQKRQLYKFCGQINPLSTPREEELRSSQSIINRGGPAIAEEIADLDEDLSADDIFVDLIEINFGMKQRDPVDSVIFFSKNGKPLNLRKDQISELLPKTFREQYVRVYAKDPAKKKIIEHNFAAWCEDNGYQIPHLLDGDPTGYFTDAHKKSEKKQESQTERQSSIDANIHVRRSLVL